MTKWLSLIADDAPVDLTAIPVNEGELIYGSNNTIALDSKNMMWAMFAANQIKPLVLELINVKSNHFY